MAVYHSIGNKWIEGINLHEFSEPSSNGTGMTLLGTGLTEKLLAGEKIDSDVIPFAPIAPNRPLTAQIRHVYTGALPQVSDRRRRKKSMIVTTAVKGIGQFEVQPRAINRVVDEISNVRGFSGQHATEKGTPIIYYSPALTKLSTIVTVEFGFDNIDTDFFEQIGELSIKAAGIPAFLSYGGYLLAAGSIIKTASKLVERFFEDGPNFVASENVDFATAGGRVPLAGFKLLTDPRYPLQIKDGYGFNEKGELLDASGKTYSGDFPYVTISLDGTVNDQFKSFEPTQASAAMLEDFYAVREGSGKDLGVLLDALKLYNDLKYRLEAEETIKKLEGVPEGSDIRKQLEEKLEALKKNILEDALKLD